MTMRRALLALLCLGLSACPSPTKQAGSEPEPAPTSTATPKPALESVVITGVPHVAQKPDFCGEAAVASWAQATGVPLSQDDVFDASGMDPARGMGVTTRELRAALARLGYAPGPVWHQVAANDPAALDALFGELHADLKRNVPSIVCMHYDDRPNTTEHFRLILGYDEKDDAVLYEEPAAETGGYRRMSRAEFLKLWPLHYDRSRWTVIRLRLDGKAELPPPRAGFGPADFAQHVMTQRARVPRGYTVLVEPPFVVVGDGPPDAVRQRAAGTVRWTVRKLEQDFFDQRPKRILDVWLLSSKASYEAQNRRLFGGPPSTPYGYYSARYGALVMNIATGGGTLVHEIVHPYMEANFPACPAWFNEGLGSLFEQSAERDGHIVGLTNWRLAGLQRAIRRGEIPSIETLTHTTDDQFYADDSGVHYAEARYLLYYLQERGLLREYYRRFHRNQKKDPSGYDTLVALLGERDMPAFQRRFERYVLGLSFP